MIQKMPLPRVLMPTKIDAGDDADKWPLFDGIHKMVHDAIGNHNRTFLTTFSNIMKSTFAGFPHEQFGPAYFNQQMASTSQNPPLKNNQPGPSNGGSTAMNVQQPTGGSVSNFGTTGNIPSSAQKIAPSVQRLARTVDHYVNQAVQPGVTQLPEDGDHPTGFAPISKYDQWNMIPCLEIGGPVDPADKIVHKLADLMEKQFGIKKNQFKSYSLPYLDWYNRLELPPRWRVPDFSKFTGTDDTSTMEHISKYLAQLGDAVVEEIHRVRFFALSLSGPAFTWYSSLPRNSIHRWEDLENKFHAYFYNETTEKDITDLTCMRMRNNETGLEYLQRFRQTRNMCFSLNLSDSQLAKLAMQGMQPYLKEKLLGVQFENLGALTQRVSALTEYMQPARKDNRFQKSANVADYYDSVMQCNSKDEEDIDAIE